MKNERYLLWTLRILGICAIIAAIYAIAHNEILLGISKFFFAALCLISISKIKNSDNTNNLIIGGMGVLLALMGVGALINHLINTHESIIQPILFIVFGIVLSLVYLRKK